MRRLTMLLVLAACTSTTNKPAEPEPEPAPPPAEVKDPPKEAPVPVDLEALARSCDGKALHDALVAMTPEQRAASTGPSARMLVAYNDVHGWPPAPPKTESTDAGANALAAVVKAELGVEAPAWWLDTLRSAKVTGDSEYFELSMAPDEDRRGKWTGGPGDTHVRPAMTMQLAESGGNLAIDLSMGRVEIGPMPVANSWLEVSRARAGTTVYVAAYQAAQGGFRFPLQAYDPTGRVWEAEVCGPDRQVLSGLGYLIVEVTVTEERVLVWTAETHGVALDVLDPASGERVAAWSSNFWFQRG